MPKGRIVYSTEPEPRQAARRVVRNVPPRQQTIYVARDRKGRGGKTVTVLSGFQHSPETLKGLLKELK
ncbi:MAG: translation initiation factor, partial [Ardenticatenaceae bacterium]